MTGAPVRRVYLISTAFQDDYEVGFANGLFRNGVPVTVVGADLSRAGRLDRGIEFLNLRGDQDPRRPAWKKSLNIVRYFGALARTALRARGAVFHTSGLFALRRGLGVLFEALWCRLVMREWWLTVHNPLPHDDQTRINRLAFGVAYRLADRLVVHTEATAAALARDFGVDRGRIQVVEHGIDRFVESDAGSRAESRARVRRRLSLPDHGVLMLVFGRVSRYKGVDTLLEAVDRAKLPDNTLVLIAGIGASPDYRAELQARMAAMRNPGRVVWRDEYVADDDIPDLLAAADAMVLPYRRIDQSGALFAAKSAGLPVIASDVGEFARYAEPGRDVLVPAGDVAALAEALSHVAAREPVDERAAHVEAARRAWAWQVTLRPYAELVKLTRSGGADQRIC